MNKYVPQSRIAPEGEFPKNESLENHSPESETKPREGMPKQAQAEAPERGTEAPSGSSESQPVRPSYWTPARLMIAGLAAAALIGAIVWWSWRPSAPSVTYDTTQAGYSTVTLSVRTTGVLTARDAIAVVPLVGGRVLSVAVESGDHVKKGQLLARLESQPLRDELLHAETKLVSTQAEVTRAETDIAIARTAAARPRNPNAPSEYDAAQARLARALADSNTLRADLREAQTDVANSRARIASLDLRATADGIVLRRNVEPGQYVRVAARQDGLFIIASDLSQLNLLADFPETALGGLHAGQPAEFTVPAFQGRVFTAELAGLDLQAKRQNVEGRLNVSYSGTLVASNREEVLRPGMSANIAVIAAQAKNVLVIPNTALGFAPARAIESKYPPPPRSTPGGRIGRVWIMKDGKLEPRDLMLGLTDGRITQVVGGPLSAGEAVATSAFVKVNGTS